MYIYISLQYNTMSSLKTTVSFHRILSLCIHNIELVDIKIWEDDLLYMHTEVFKFINEKTSFLEIVLKY